MRFFLQSTAQLPDRFIIPIFLGKKKNLPLHDPLAFPSGNTLALTLPSVELICVAKPFSHWESRGQLKLVFSCTLNVSVTCITGDTVMTKESSQVSHNTLTGHVYKQLPLLQYQRLKFSDGLPLLIG